MRTASEPPEYPTCTDRPRARFQRLHRSEFAMTHVLHRNLRATPPVAVTRRGVYLTDAAGKQYLDTSGGAAVSTQRLTT